MLILDAFRRRLAGNKKLDGLFNLDITLKHLCLRLLGRVRFRTTELRWTAATS